MGEKEKKQVEGDRVIMVSRETCLNLLFGAPNPLKQCIASFDECLESTRPSVDSQAALGRAAPSRTFRQLRTFNEWLSEIEQILECQSVKDLEQAKVTLNHHFKGPVSDLVSAAKGSLNDVQRALKALKKAAEQAAAAKPSTSKPGKKRLESRAHGPAVFQAVEAMSKVSEIKEGEELPDFDYPALRKEQGARRRRRRSAGSRKQQQSMMRNRRGNVCRISLRQLQKGRSARSQRSDQDRKRMSLVFHGVHGGSLDSQTSL